MTSKDRETIELIVANDDRTNDTAPGDAQADQLSSAIKLFPIARLLARQAARDLHRTVNDNREPRKKRPRE